MIMNYNKWFYEQHKYLTGNRDGKTTFNDTKWVELHNRYRTLVEMGSKLLDEQPFGVVGNNKGFDKLLDLMARSNYTFEDINDSLIETYRVSLKNAMSKMLVNTHAVMCHCTNMDRDIVSMDKFTHYYIIDIPFNQLHFGDRDEFIRQKLHKMHNTNTDHYIPMSEFNTSEITSILGFSILCTINGFICNDCQIAVDDKGFKFKIGWLYSTDAEFIIYKLDEAFTYKCEISSEYLMRDDMIPYDVLGNIKTMIDPIGKNCLVNIYDKNFIKTIPSVPNFGTFNDEGLVLKHLQQKTVDDIKRNKTKTVTIVVYAFKYIHEVPNVYPAVNYYDIMDSRRVFTEDHDNVLDVEGNRILSSSTKNVNELEVCTPPIVLDRPINLSFKTILSCLGMYDSLICYEKTFRGIGAALQTELTNTTFKNNVANVINAMYGDLYECYENYIKGAILTSLVPSKSIENFKSLLDSLDQMRNATYTEAQKYTIDEYYGDYYKLFVTSIAAPFRNNILSNFNDLGKLSKNYFVDNNDARFNRPVAEQCFITLKYDREESCWLFTAPTIKHFKGIGNTFYIDDDLKGDEIFKFFVLYTDTESPTEQNVPSLDMETVLDFDLFCQEVEKHIGYIRYWDAENRLLKISKVMYDKYDGETCVQVLSKILKRKIDGSDLIDIYPSDINYEPSNITSDNINADEDDDRAPFAINFLFYTLSMLNQNEDKLQTHFFRHLTNNKFNPRYVDIDISEILSDVYTNPINYSQFSIAPNTVDLINSNLPSDNNSQCVFYGLPLIIDSNGSVLSDQMYRYTFNVYNDDTKHHLITGNDVDHEHYIQYNDSSQFGHGVYEYHDDIHICKLMTFYLTYMYGYISELQTNYTKTFNQTSCIESGIETITTLIHKIDDFVGDGKIFMNPNTQTVVDSVLINNAFINHLNSIKEQIKQINTCRHNGKSTNIIEFVNDLLSKMKHVYVTTGFDNYASPSARMLYIHLKKINSSMNIYQYKHWLSNIDLDTLRVLDNTLAKNENYNLGNNVFITFYRTLNAYVEQTIPMMDTLDVLVNGMTTMLGNTHIKPIVSYCDDIIQRYIFDMFILDKVEYDDSKTYDRNPHHVLITTTKDNHFYPPVGTALVGETTLLLQPITEMVEGRYKINSITKICEYAFFSGESISDCTMNVFDDGGSLIGSVDVALSFEKIGTSADIINTFNQISNIHNTMIDVQNIHESYDINEDGLIVNKKHADMNYEMLIGNHFMQLDYIPELILDRNTMLPGSVDRVSIPNQKINDFVNADYGNHMSRRVFFKPSQVLHLPMNDDDSITSVGGKYFVGQHIYLSTNDGLYTFPAIVTATDHSINHGFVEAVVDNQNAKWFTINDSTMISKYLTDTVECVVVDDNIRNFLDEYTDGSYQAYPFVEFNKNIDMSDEEIHDAYSLPGDPLFIQNNTDYVHTRLNWFFNDLIPNRFIDEEHKKHRFVYMGDGFINNENDCIKIKMINHNFNPLTNPEMYPTLREEPNDHEVWDAEMETFQRLINGSKQTAINQERGIELHRARLNFVTTEFDRQKILNEIDSLERKLAYEQEYQKRLESYIQHLEPPTTWYNVRAYEDTLVYIANGRAKISPSFISNIRDIPFTDKLNVFLYDWEHKCWLSPDLYTVETNMVDAVKICEYDDYKTNNVLHSITITPTQDFVPSKKLLVYLSYDKSDIFDDVEMHPYTCDVQFKPILSLDNINNSYEPYHDIRVRKHFDGYERYVFNGYNPPTDFSIKESFHIIRPKRNGKYTYSPTIRFCDLLVQTPNSTYKFDEFDLYVRMPFKDVSTSRMFKVPKYDVTINQPIDGFVPDQTVKLICIQNNDLSLYDGNVSNIMFEGFTSYDGNTQNITISKTSLPDFIEGEFICTVFQDDMYKSSGGVITVTISFDETDLIDDLNCWVKVPTTLASYREIPNECILVPKSTIDVGSGIEIIFKNTYEKKSSDIVNVDNQSIFNPYEYYFDTIHETKLPVSDVRRNAHNERLVIDQDLNPDISLIKSTYLSICRYSLQRIPQDGFIDMTGYIPTPLSRDRYEFWVNGRCITNKDDIIILSPTTIQLCNLTSLRNFELIELVDDMNTSNIIQEGNVYVDLNGKTFSSYKLALLSNHNIVKQDIRFMYNTNQHQPIHDYTSNIITKPNNYDIEEDILDSISIDTSSVTDYNQLHNLPSINGVTIFHPKLSSIGIVDIPNDKIVELFDKIWSKEIITDPLFMYTHRDGMTLRNDQHLTLHIKSTDDGFMIYTKGTTSNYFTLYISKRIDGVIDDVVNTVKIIPFIRTGVYVLIDKSYEGMWLHSTMTDCVPIEIK